MQRSVLHDALQIRGPSLATKSLGPGSAEQREERCAASGTPAVIRANHFMKNRSDLPTCQVSFLKIFCFPEMPNHPKAFSILSRQKGRCANVSNAGRDAMDAGDFLDEESCLRTAKPWGPGTPTLVSSLWKAISIGEGG
jgi:hypothetical protein